MWPDVAGIRVSGSRPRCNNEIRSSDLSSWVGLWVDEGRGPVERKGRGGERWTMLSPPQIQREASNE